MDPSEIEETVNGLIVRFAVFDTPLKVAVMVATTGAATVVVEMVKTFCEVPVSTVTGLGTTAAGFELVTETTAGPLPATPFMVNVAVAGLPPTTDEDANVGVCGARALTTRFELLLEFPFETPIAAVVATDTSVVWIGN